MNFQPNFEQYKADQARIEKIPKISPDFHYFVNDIAAKILDAQELTQKEYDDLEMVYESTQDLEKELVMSLDQYRSKNLITTPEFLVCISYFLAANQNGPESSQLKNEVLCAMMSSDDFKELSKKVSIPENTRSLLVSIYGKIKVL